MSSHITEYMELLACPACKKELQTVKNCQYLQCINCDLLFPVIENIPVLLLDEAVKAEKENIL
jgi:uncharacterized protein YbaR (Trm112 family)